MGQHKEISPDSQLDAHYAFQGMTPVTTEGPAAPTAADRLYQLAALTAGILFFVTLL
jgi:hypothetical protein